MIFLYFLYYDIIVINYFRIFIYGVHNIKIKSLFISHYTFFTDYHSNNFCQTTNYKDFSTYSH